MSNINVAEHMPLVYKIIGELNPIFHIRYEHEDLVQMASLLLVKAGKLFDETKGYKFSTYAIPYIRKGMLRFLSDDKRFNIRRGEPHKFKIRSLEYEYESEGNNPIVLKDYCGENEFEEILSNKISVEKGLDILDPVTREVIKLYFYEDKTQKDIVKITHTSQADVCRKLKRGLNILRQYMSLDM